jgi:hypothetical protein
MCKIAGIECEVITGFTKWKEPRIDKTGHAWNAINIEGKWYLLDVTWGAGYVNKGIFYREYEPDYFMVNPRFFASNHIPDDPKWQLLDQPHTEATFVKQPWLNYSDRNFALLSVQPMQSPLKRSGNQVSLRFKFKYEKPILLAFVAGKEVKVEQTSDEDGYVVLKFNARSKTAVDVMCGKAKSGTFYELARYYVE